MGPKKEGKGNKPRGRPPASIRNGPKAPKPTFQPSRSRVISECDDNHCPVCLNRIIYFAVGLCNHPVCSECSTRMRVLCQQNECPICRQDMPKVVHTSSRVNFGDVEHNPYKMDKKFRICFENEDISKSYYTTLEHKCPKCEEDVVFRNLRLLDQHLRRNHELFFCDLCLEHLKIFNYQRKAYTRAELATHRRKGDPDDSSHRGHPACEFCSKRFFDKDELYLHLRREHFFCHFCDADGKQIYFQDYPDLRNHFQSEHFLCTEGNCMNEQFTSAFRTDIDLKAHIVDRHRGVLSKVAERQNRIVEVDFVYSRSREQSIRSQRERRSPSPPSLSSSQPPSLTSESFPSLGSSTSSSFGTAGAVGGNSAVNRLAKSSGFNSKWSDGRKKPAEEDFPSLPGASAALMPAQTKKREPKKELKKASKPARQNPSPSEEFPTLLSSSKSMPSFRPSNGHSSPAYRNVGGGPTKSWGSESQTSSSNPQTDCKTEKKKTNPPLNNVDFPSLQVNFTSASSTAAEAPKKSIPKQKSQKKSNGECADLRSAADIISGPKMSCKSNEINQDGTWEKVEHSKGKSMKSTPNGVSSEPIPGLNFASLSITKPTVNETKTTGSKFKEVSSSKPDFPELGPSSKHMGATFRPSNLNTSKKTSAWVNSGEANSTCNSHGRKPPPGFNILSNKNKSGPPGFGNKVDHKYYQPQDFQHRNNALLMLSLKLLGGGKSLEFIQFKKLSSLFHKGDLTCQEYYDHCLELMKPEVFAQLLPELIVLLPNILKQQDLFKVHHERKGELKLKLEVCERCNQILSLNDTDFHNSSHFLDKDFPVL